MPARRHRRLVPLAALTVVLSGCGGTALPPHDAAPRVQAATNTSAQPSARLGEAEVVIAISIDGLNPTALRRLGRAGAPAIHRMRRQGASTLNARTERELTRTLPNHTGMLTGRPVGGPDGHRVTFNEDNGAILAATAGHYVAGVFDVVHDHGGRTAFYASKDKFDFLARSWDRAHGAADTTGADDGRDKLDRYVVDRERVNVSRLVARLDGTPDTFSFVHLAGPDTAGHAQGFMSRGLPQGGARRRPAGRPHPQGRARRRCAPRTHRRGAHLRPRRPRVGPLRPDEGLRLPRPLRRRGASAWPRAPTSTRSTARVGRAPASAARRTPGCSRSATPRWLAW